MPSIGYTLTLQVSYSANSGSGAPSMQQSGPKTVEDLPYTLRITLSSTRPTRTGYSFLGWSKASNATSASYQPGEVFEYTFNAVTDNYAYTASILLYAVWKKRTYTVAYKKGTSGSGTEVNDTKTYGVALTLRGAIFTRQGYEHVGWSTTDGGAQTYSLGSSYTKNEAITLYPVWKKKTQAYMRVAGSWKDSMIYIKVGGVWKEVTGAYVKVGGAWKST